GAGQLGRNVELAEKLAVGRGRRRDVIPPELRGARGRGDQDARRRKAAAAQLADELEGDDRSHAVSPEGERLREVRLDGSRERIDQRRHALEGRFGETRLTSG